MDSDSLLTPTGKRDGRKHEYRCACGSTTWAKPYSVRIGSIKSCGCLRRKKAAASARKLNEGKVKLVGGVRSRNHPFHGKWCQMRYRCNRKTHPKYRIYGERGIRVCPRWDNTETGFANFIEDMGECPPGYTLDRIDNDGDYTPENCRWASQREQSNNTRRNITLTLDGDTMTAAEWARVLRVSASTIRRRLKNGWTDEQTLVTPMPSLI